MKSWLRKKTSPRNKFWSIYHDVLSVTWTNFTVVKYNLKISNIYHHIKFRKCIMNRCSIKKPFLKILQYSQENTCVGVSFLVKIRAFSPVKKTPTQTFPMNIVKFLRTPVLKNSCERLFERFAAWINNITSNMWIEEEIFSKKPKKAKQKQTKKQRKKKHSKT